LDAGATQVGIFSEQVWVLSGERHQPVGAALVAVTTRFGPDGFVGAVTTWQFIWGWLRAG
jgi:hypothetical protein